MRRGGATGQQAGQQPDGDRSVRDSDPQLGTSLDAPRCDAPVSLLPW
jgi:hypothetical protein